jgi:hypothetical protein
MNTTEPSTLRSDAATKRLILAFLASEEHGAATPEISNGIGVCLKLTRNHLYQLERSGRVASISTGSGNSKRITWGLPGYELTAPRTVGDHLPAGDIDAENEAWPQRSHAPAGTWRIDHQIAARSVFENVGAA